jgi:hypothetical protein
MDGLAVTVEDIDARVNGALRSCAEEGALITD